MAGPRGSQPIGGPFETAPFTRRPDGVLLDPEPASPPTVTRAEARGVVSLREPVAAAAIARFVLEFLDAWRRESLDELAALLSKDAGPVEARSRGRDAVVEGWRQRLKAHAHEFARLDGELVRPERIEHWDWEEVGALGIPAGADVSPGEIFVRVPLEVTHAGTERLFGDLLVMVLRRDQGGLRIAAYGETDSPMPR
jgi:hypothetical protein